MTGMHAQPRVITIDPGVQVEQEPQPVESIRPWRVITTDTYGMTGIAPVCPDQDDVTKHSTGDGYGKVVDPHGVYDCCPGPHIELWSEDRAAAMAALFTEVEAMAAGS